eukprot:TRINITY_DN3239_c0_g1_i1.p1 TRINITY_DN3239_c0_g1~~TRINITY_DN3239_c0_g1_i1.p1  ORF type:complete len:1182 (-),score=147.79 TRINITY_DN3239_c0_g1_i1:2514-6059(-)
MPTSVQQFVLFWRQHPNTTHYQAQSIDPTASTAGSFKLPSHAIDVPYAARPVPIRRSLPMGTFQPSRRKSDRPLLQNATRRRTPLRARPAQPAQPTPSSSGSASSAPPLPTPVPPQNPSASIPRRPLLRSVPNPSPPKSRTLTSPAAQTKATAPPPVPVPSTPAFRPAAAPCPSRQPPVSRNKEATTTGAQTGTPPLAVIPSSRINGLRELFDLLIFLQETRRDDCLQQFVTDAWNLYNSKYSKKRKVAERQAASKNREHKPSNHGSTQSPQKAPETQRHSSVVSNAPTDVICIDDDDDGLSPPQLDSDAHQTKTVNGAPPPHTHAPRTGPLASSESQRSARIAEQEPKRQDVRLSRQYQLDKQKKVADAVEARYKYFSSNAGIPEQSYSTEKEIYHLWQPSDQSKPVVQLQADLCSICFRAEDGHVYDLHLEALRFLWYYLIENPCSGGVFVHGLGYPRAHLLFVFSNILIQNAPQGKKFKLVVLCPDECLYEWKWARDCFTEFAQGMVLEEQSCFESLQQWSKQSGLLICSYSSFIFLTENEDSELQERAREALCHPGPDLFVLDEASRLGKMNLRMTTTLRCIRTAARLAMTSAPLSSNLARAWSVIDWACPRFLGPRRSFWNTLVKPLTDAVNVSRKLSPGEEVLWTDRYLRHKLAVVSFGPRFLSRKDTLFQSGRYTQESVIHVHMHKGHRREYRRLLKCLAIAIQEGLCSPIVAAHLLSIFASVGLAALPSFERELRQLQEDRGRSTEVGSGPFHISLPSTVLPILQNPMLKSIPWAKLDALRFMAGMCMNDNERLVVFVFSESLLDDVVCSLREDPSLNRKKIHRLSLTEDPSERQDKLQQFNTSAEGSVLVAPYGPNVDLMEGAGWCFVNATRIVFLNAVWHHAAYVQAVNRAHNFAQRNNIVYIHHIIAADSVEEALCEMKVSSTPFNEEGGTSGQSEVMEEPGILALKLLPQIPMQFFNDISVKPKEADRAQAKLARRAQLMDQWRDHFNFLTPLINIRVDGDYDTGDEREAFLIRSIDIEKGLYESCAVGLDDHSPKLGDGSKSFNVDLYLKEKRAHILYDERVRLPQLAGVTEMGAVEFDRKIHVPLSLLENGSYFETEADMGNDIRSSWVEYFRLYEDFDAKLEPVPSESDGTYASRKRKRSDFEREHGPSISRRGEVTNLYTLSEHI